MKEQRDKLRPRRCPYCGKEMWGWWRWDCGACGVRWDQDGKCETRRADEAANDGSLDKRGVWWWVEVPEGCMVVEKGAG